MSGRRLEATTFKVIKRKITTRMEELELKSEFLIYLSHSKSCIRFSSFYMEMKKFRVINEQNIVELKVTLIYNQMNIVSPRRVGCLN